MTPTYGTIDSAHPIEQCATVVLGVRRLMLHEVSFQKQNPQFYFGIVHGFTEMKLETKTPQGVSHQQTSHQVNNSF